MAIDYKTPRKIKDPSAPARVIGKPSTITVGLRGPNEDEVQASRDNAAGRTIQAPRGVYRYRSHDDANAQMDQWLAQSLAQESRAAAIASLRAIALERYRSRCFWNIKVPDGAAGDRIIVDRLKKHGDMAAWRLAVEIEALANAA